MGCDSFERPCRRHGTSDRTGGGISASKTVSIDRNRLDSGQADRDCGQSTHGPTQDQVRVDFFAFAGERGTNIAQSTLAIRTIAEIEDSRSDIRKISPGTGTRIPRCDTPFAIRNDMPARAWRTRRNPFRNPASTYCDQAVCRDSSRTATSDSKTQGTCRMTRSNSVSQSGSSPLQHRDLWRSEPGAFIAPEGIGESSDARFTFDDSNRSNSVSQNDIIRWISNDLRRFRKRPG